MKRLSSAILILLLTVSLAFGTVSTSTSRIVYNANGVTVAFPFTFGVGETEEIKVVLTTSAGVETVLTETTHYTVDCTNDDCESGGTVTTVATYATGNTITVLRNVPITQETDFTEGMPALYETFEDGLDKSIRIDQQQQEEINRTAKLSKSSAYAANVYTLPDPVAGASIGWDSSGSDLTTYPLPSVFSATYNDDYCYPDYNEADQGVVGSLSTIKSCVDGFGAINGTIYLRHNSGAATTTYTLTTAETTPVNINLVIEKGALIGGVGAQTIYSPANIKAGERQQIKTGAGLLVFTVGGTVYPDWWATNTTPGTTNMTAAINSACASVTAITGVVFFPVDTYKITSTVDFSGCILRGVSWSQPEELGSRILFDVAADTALYATGKMSGVENLILQKDASFAWAEAIQANSIGIHIHEAAGSYIRNCSVSSQATTVKITADAGTYNYDIRQNVFRNYTIGIHLLSSETALSIPPNATRIVDNTLIGDSPAGGTAIKLEGNATHTLAYVWVMNNRIENHATVFDIKLITTCQFLYNGIETLTTLFNYNTNLATDAVNCTYEAGGGALAVSTKGFLPAALTAPTVVYHGRQYAAGQSANLELDGYFGVLDYNNTTKTGLLKSGDADIFSLDSNYVAHRFINGKGFLILDDLTEKGRIEKSGIFVGQGYHWKDEFDQDPLTTAFNSWVSKFWTIGGTNDNVANVTLVGGPGGAVKMLTAGADNDSVYIQGDKRLHTSKNVKMEFSFQMYDAAAAHSYIAIGFTEDGFDDKGTPDNDCVLFTFDSDTDTNWTLRSNDGGVGVIADDLGVVADATVTIVRLDLTDSEQPRVWINGTEIAAGLITGTATAAGAFRPYIMIQTLNIAQERLDVQWIQAWQEN